ncbi:erythromycin esterase family protein [Streptomyces tsukubensis]|uniref:erythromycin esterase family protein n=1 Tax=Streptomyces tsukubensis TaxID=83656 RepID=UPI0036D0D7DE
MTISDPSMPRRTVLRTASAVALGGLVAAAAPAAATAAPVPPAAAGPPGPGADPLPALRRAARPLADLRPLEDMVGAAAIVGVGEATHSSREFFRTKNRIFRQLVEHCGFTTFMLETPWSSGVRLNAYVLRGEGDLRQIMEEEFQSSYLLWRTQEYLDLLRWMRQYNLRRPDRPVRFAGNDCSYAGPELFDTVTAHVAGRRPELLPRLRALYAASRPVGSLHEWTERYLTRPIPERRAMAAEVAGALELVESVPAGTGAAAREHAWAVQHARAIAQVGEFYTHDYFASAEARAEMMLYRDRIMAENTVRWHRLTGEKVLLSAHNGHVGYESTRPDMYPRLQGAFIRDLMGSAYICAGFTFGRGSFNAMDLDDPAEPIRRFSVGPPGPGSNEEMLERVRPGNGDGNGNGNYYIDMRTAAPSARRWLGSTRLTRSIGNSWPEAPLDTDLLSSYDVLIHLPRISAADRI